ncbi:maltotransferase domain-containing protein [Amycolatopsis regifaucium]|uniref:Alpha-1,4-glucan:maltose-1-phosphate maltosyltransferase n=1 Tax=Amycolatopsis regifaucium TaxID=546365 RepID=A0A154M5N7_9PSEU|nr:maltotransferase domain-containing protein [Amycolatopsis regifaucium]KZB79866.1 alpha-1,4-glucan--maltose-1-phosphate maltosyltransferase [Amycolatopsis regifaucium]OKA09817.1 alpha-1,4-glucan--maltose-1-phosphate maltosyltransferase [Amycolatopsis regifaucium]SFJ34593.1 alpha-1,4-glucan:maltose-1-phosphate maltosyltransferase [Amycolatopsis regifaucium]
MTGRLGIDDVSPCVSCGRYPAKAVVGEHIPVTATVWREGHDAVAATVAWRGPGDRLTRQTRMAPRGADHPDSFAAVIVPDARGLWTYRVDAWSDPWATWTHAVEVKVAAGQGPDELANDLEIGARLLERLARRPDRRAERALLTGAVTALRDTERALLERIGPALSPEVRQLMHEFPVRELVTKGKAMKLWVDRERAAYGAWYEFFPRSTGGMDEHGRPVHGTFTTAAAELDRVARMGFDVVYLPPIHPIGRVNRKGPNNTLDAGPDDVGSPWAIGADEGGHDAVHPELGTLEDFDAFVARAGDLGLEVALDLALQAAPDHPWVLKHPEFFTTRPDGSIAYAENPPKKYQDIYPINFDNDPKAIYEEVLRVVLHWVDHGVRIFRVDNPHTKPPDFWAWLIQSVKEVDPDVVFLAEAFTRPARLWGLARLGFSQSYTYFTWRTGKQELIDFGVDLWQHWDEGRPNLFVNTPDILHESLQRGGPGMFALRAALAATLSPTWGVYSGYELFEHLPVREGSEEYLDSEKYQLRPRDFEGALAEGRSLEPWLTKLNVIRRAHPALRQMRTLYFHHIDNDALLAYSKQDPATGDTVVTVVTLDPYMAQEGTLYFDMDALGFEPHDRLIAQDEVTGDTWDWGQANFVRLEPWRAVAHVVALRRRLAT